MKCIILAGGFATRLWPLTEKTPKPLVQLGEKQLLSYIVEKVPDSIEIILSVNSSLAHYFENWLKSQNYNRKQIKIFVEDAASEGEKLGALYATARCIQENHLEDDLLILAGDNYFDFTIRQFREVYKNKPLIAVYDVQDYEEAKKFGVVIGNKGKVEGFQEKPVNPQSTLVSTGCYIIPKDQLAELCSFAEDNRDNLGGMFEHFLRIGEEVDYFSFSGDWFDIGSFHSFLNAHKRLCKGNLIRARGVLIKNSHFKGGVYLGAGVRVDNALVEDSVILPGARIQSASIRNSIVGQNAIISGVDLDWKILRDESFVVR